MSSWGPGHTNTIGVDLWGHQVRGQAPNARTLVHSAQRPPGDVRRDLRSLYKSAYRAFADRCRAVDEPGLAVVAVNEHTGAPQGIVQLRARVERHVAAIVGRHDRADLYLDSSVELALRHLAVIVDPVTDWRRGSSAVRFRVLDLRTTQGFCDEQDRTLRGLRAEGPALLRCAGHALFMLPLGDPSDWPQTADDAWAFLPERVYFDELSRVPEGSLTRLPQVRANGPRTSQIFRTAGVRDTRDGMVSEGPAAGVLELVGPGLSGEIRLSDAALRDGVLLGRYERCDNAGFSDDLSLSRVHALLIHIDDRLMIVDTASINGTRLVGEHRQRLIELRGETELQLGKGTRARWRYVS
ncbi:MAG TPA: FHA domain-containing protein [Kofleriaceae bacterium]|nr:FHA domain-containing protein [Kofleriaceae bacterium]